MPARKVFRARPTRPYTQRLCWFDLNITYNGLSVDYPLDIGSRVSDADVRRIPVELVRSGGLRGLVIANLPDDAFDDYVVDRFGAGRVSERIYLRPKVPFGARG